MNYVPFKHIFYLQVDGRNAAVIAHNPSEARGLARVHEPDGDWERAGYASIAKVSDNHTCGIVALERKINLTKEQAREILKSEDCCYGEGQGGDLSFLLKEIAATFPNLAAEFSYLFKDSSYAKTWSSKKT